MEVLYPHCAGLDIHKETVVACAPHMADAGKTTVMGLAKAGGCERHHQT